MWNPLPPRGGLGGEPQYNPFGDDLPFGSPGSHGAGGQLNMGLAFLQRYAQAAAAASQTRVGSRGFGQGFQGSMRLPLLENPGPDPAAMAHSSIAHSPHQAHSAYSLPASRVSTGSPSGALSALMLLQHQQQPQQPQRQNVGVDMLGMFGGGGGGLGGRASPRANRPSLSGLSQYQLPSTSLAYRLNESLDSARSRGVGVWAGGMAGGFGRSDFGDLDVAAMGASRLGLGGGAPSQRRGGPDDLMGGSRPCAGGWGGALQGVMPMGGAFGVQEEERDEESQEVLELLKSFGGHTEMAIFARISEELVRMREELRKSESQLALLTSIAERLEADPDARPPHEEEVEAGKLVQPRYWNQDEHQRFVEAIQLFGTKDIKTVSVIVGTRTIAQVRTHLRKFFQKHEASIAALDQDVPSAKRRKKNAAEDEGD